MYWDLGENGEFFVIISSSRSKPPCKL